VDRGGSAQDFDQPPTADILSALRELLESATLRLSERNRRFLSFVVNETVAGHADRIKAYLIGVDVFGRDETFDPNVDPIVRIEATRLRSALTAHYETHGTDMPVRISMPPGSYVPLFSWSPAAVPAVNKSQSERHHASVVIKDRTAQSDSETALRGELFADALAIRLREAQLKVFAIPPQERKAANASLNDLFANPGDAVSLDITVRSLGAHRRFSWQATNLRNGEITCCDFCDHPAASTPCFALIDGIADRVVASLCKELGLRWRAS
jgi:hypothetical protein